ncbi:MAG: BON domain-containing protein [Desulfofustis sp.]|nr:BON domain-containing protein [Desulfofustis sp.]
MKKPHYVLAVLTAFAATLAFTSTLFASEMDDRIELSARESFVFKTYLQDDDISLESKDGMVTLTGTVSDASHRSLAGDTVAGLPGVTAVDNQLIESGETPAEKSSAWLITKVKATLLLHRNVNGSATEVTAENGVITLRGQAESNAQKDLTAEYARDVEGVSEVVNEMTVSADAADTGGTTITEKMAAIGEKIDDASITALVKTTLFYHRSTSGLNTTVETKDGVVTLGGKAKTAAEKDLAGKFASDVNGVNTVNNTITVE